MKEIGRNMSGCDSELCGFLDAKLPGSRYMSHRVRKRPLAPWKAWRRHWCSVRKLGPGLGVEVHLDRGLSSDGNDRNNSIKVPSDSIICRTESRTKHFAFGIFPGKERKPLLYLCGTSESETQRWMANLRQLLKPRRHRFMEGTFNISMVDNTHSRAAGLSGLHGDLVASRSGLFIKDVHTGDIIENLDWKEMSQFHLVTAGRPEDVKRICVIHTTKEFRGGPGELHVFCMNAPKLLQDLVTQGRGPKHKQTTRPLSLSEGDLRLSVHTGHTEASPSFVKSKVASTLINAGLGMLLSSRSGSEAKLLHQLEDSMTDSKLTGHLRAVDNVYQPEPASIPNISASLEELEEPSPRRVSTVSIASGIYEEIVEDLGDFRRMRIHSNLYEDPNEILIMSGEVARVPPPLPPRKRCGSGSTRTGSISDDGLDSEGGTRSATPTPEERVHAVAPLALGDSDYVPMSPRVKDIALQLQGEKRSAPEEVYMVMR
ncbi:uncharacterized protein LOC107036477 [Diachasma alloeum]|uniref:uncharacterized protein LOC107036477 n=1 Tax=Diachasma alloeum TaxID=454923 RepID=UPI0007384CD1|nr:uncharacterized protein LOC107036477 [Diachasma alloeum]